MRAIRQVLLIFSALWIGSYVVAQSSLPQQRHFDTATGILVEPCVTLDGVYARGSFQLVVNGSDSFELQLVSAELIDAPTAEDGRLGSACSEVSNDEFSSQLIYNFLDILMINGMDDVIVDNGRRFELYTVSSIDDFRFAINEAVENQVMDVVVLEDLEPVVVAGPDLNSLPFETEPGDALSANYTFNYAGTAFYDGLSNSLSIQFDEGNESGRYSLSLRLSDPSNGLIDGGAIYPIEYTATEEDEPEDDTPPIPDNFPPSFSAPGTLSVAEDAGAQSLPNWVTAISPGPASESTQTVSLTLSVVTNAALFAVQPLISDTGDLSFTVAPDAFGTASFTLQATDSDGASSSLHTVTLNATAVNDPPSFTVPATVGTAEDSGAQSLVNWVTSIDTGPVNEAQTMSFNVSNDNNGLFAVQPAISSDGRLTYTGAADAHGSAELTIEGSDGIDSHTPASVTLTITEVNDKPTFTAPTTLNIDEDAGPQTENPWATAILAGPADESAQTVSFNVSNDNNGLFAVQPAVSNAGVLTFTPADDAFGTAVITVTAADSAGETSLAHELALTINAVNDPPVFTSGGTITVPEDNGGDGSNSLTSWATAISTGPANEGQTISFTVSNNNSGLFTSQPAIDSAGTLSFTTAPNVSGTAELTITASDGVDSTAVVNETLNITPVNDAPTATTHLTAGSRTIHTDEDAFTLIFFDAADVEGDDFTFALTSAADNGQFYFSKNTANVANRISSLTFDISGTTDPIAELFDPVALSEITPTEFPGTSATFSQGFVIAYLPNADQLEPEDFSLIFRDEFDADSAARDFSVTLAAMNDAPLITHSSGHVLAGDTNPPVLVVGEYLTDPHVAVPYVTTYEVGGDENLGLSMVDVDVEGLSSTVLYAVTLTTTLPAECTVQYYGPAEGPLPAGVRDLAAHSVASKFWQYGDIQTLTASITASCPNDGTTGNVTVIVTDGGLLGDCKAPNPKVALGEIALDGKRCVRASWGVVDLTFSDPI